MIRDFFPHRPRPDRWLAEERAGLAAMSRPAAAATGLLALLLAIPLLSFCWCNLNQWTFRLDIASSSQIEKVQEILKAGSRSLSNWNDTTSLLLDTPLTLAALLAPLTGDVFTAY